MVVKYTFDFSKLSTDELMAKIMEYECRGVLATDRKVNAAYWAARSELTKRRRHEDE